VLWPYYLRLEVGQAAFLTENINDPVLNRISFPPKLPIYTSSKFSNDGKWILIGTSGRTHYVLDSFNCSIVARLEGASSRCVRWARTSVAAGHESLDKSGLPANTVLSEAQVGASGQECCWTPDSRYVISGAPPSCQFVDD
jgi:COMPASS component SWD2